MTWQGMTPIPDPGFMRKLRTFDPNLDCEFNREVERFIITQPSRLRSGKLVAAIVENPGKDVYRQPDDRDLHNLARADFERKSHKDRIREGEQAMLEKPIQDEKHAESEIRDATKDNRLQLQHMYRRVFKMTGDDHNPAFRRITHKPKGKVFDPPFKVVDRRKVK